jgi:GlcNAc-P-P-Und epimerase
MKIGVTGGSGFIGTRLRIALEKAGHVCVNIDLRDENPIDILDLPALTKSFEGCDAVYHLAAEHRDDVFPRSRYYDVNVTGTGNVTKAADANGIKRVIFTSSFAVYGLNTGAPDEAGKTDPFNDYGQSKLEGEEVLRAWVSKKDDVRLTIVRPVVIFGEGNRGNVYNLIHQVARGKFVMVGRGDNKKSMAYIGNVVAFLQTLLGQSSPYELYNYADKPDFSMNDLMALIREKLGQEKPLPRIPYALGLTAGYTFDAAARLTRRTFPISAVRIQKFCADTTCTADKARRDGFTPPYTLAEGIARMIDHDFPPQTTQRKAG